ncbi:MAG: SOS response-associated peptidase [Opitutus sp.]|nr:SOS response-associated peptidase [Opitutus sp.]
MCTRFVLLQEHLREMLKQLGLGEDPGYVSRYNIAPSTPLAAVRSTPQRDRATLRWGLVPSWAKEDVGAKMVNARAETLAEKPAFRDALRQRRCVIPASGYYEWQTVGTAKLPWLFQLRDEQPFVFAGLWETWRDGGGAPLETCAIVTTTPNELAGPIHNRMPVVLEAAGAAAWLDPGETDPARLTRLLQKLPAEKMTARAVSRYVSHVRHEGPACLAAPGDEPAADDPQLSLNW